MPNQRNNQTRARLNLFGRNQWLRHLLLISVVFLISGCSSDRPRIGDWYQHLQGKNSRIRIAYLGTPQHITDDARIKNYRYISGADIYQDEECFAYEDSEQVLWEKIRFLTIEPVSNLNGKYIKVTGIPDKTPQD